MRSREAGLVSRRSALQPFIDAVELADLTVLHYDHDFELIASVTRQPHEWIVPRGSIDLRQKYRDGVDEPRHGHVFDPSANGGVIVSAAVAWFAEVSRYVA